MCGLYNVTATSASDVVTAVSDTAVNATDDVTATTAALSPETTASQNQASDPSSRLLSTLAPGVSRGVSQITTAVTPTDAAASTPNAVIQLSFVAATVTDVQTPNVEADPVVSDPGIALVVTDGTVPATDTVMAIINKVSPSTQAVSLMTEAVARANDVLTPADDMIASAMDAAAPTTISASLATDEVEQTMNEMKATLISATSGIALVTEIVPLSTDAITLALDDIQRPDAASATQAVAPAKFMPSPALRTVPPTSLPVIPAPESAENVSPDASSSKEPSPIGLTLEALAPEPKAPEVVVPEVPPPDVTVPKAPAPEAAPPPPEVAVPEAPLPEPPTPEVAASVEPPPVPASKSNSHDPAPPPEARPPDAPSLEASPPESPPLDAVGPKAPSTSKAVSLPDALLPDALLPIPKAKQKEKTEPAKSRNQGAEKKKPGIFPCCNYTHSRTSQCFWRKPKINVKNFGRTSGTHLQAYCIFVNLVGMHISSVLNKIESNT